MKNQAVFSLLLALLLILTGFGSFVTADDELTQSLACGADDRECLEESWGLACGTSVPAESWHSSCLSWLEQVQGHPFAEHPEWKLMAGLGYANVALRSASQEETEHYNESSRALFSEVIAAWPGTVYASQAYIGLASLAMVADDGVATVSYLRQGMQTDPGNSVIPYQLAGALRSMSHASGNRDGLREAADMYRLAYTSGFGGWYTAANALQTYEAAGDADQAEQFLSEVASDSGMSGFADEVVSSGFGTSPGRAGEVLETACHSWIVAIFGPETCANGIDTLVTATRTTSSLARRQAIADVAAEAIRRLTVANGVSTAERRQFSQRYGAVLREWIDSGAATASVYVRWARHEESGLDESVAAYERALELEPDNAQYRYWMSMLYITQGRFDEAIENLLIARDTLPENVGLTPESVTNLIERAEQERDRTP